MASFEAFNLLIQDIYDFKRVDNDTLGKHPYLALIFAMGALQCRGDSILAKATKWSIIITSCIKFDLPISKPLKDSSSTST
jgi:hypothetical protein